MSDIKQAVRDVELTTPVRNRYFWGKMLDVYHLELEQATSHGRSKTEARSPR
jgi:hypothetical protein